MMPDKVKVVLDTNIVVSSALCIDGNPAKVFEMILLEKIKNYTTEEIIKEISKVMERPKIAKRLSLVEIEFIMDNYRRFSEKIGPKISITESEDPDDNKFLECAVEADVDFIISGDEHLLKLKEFKGIQIVTPAEFLRTVNRV